MPIPSLPVASPQDANFWRRHRETTNRILNHDFDDSRVRTRAEIAAGVTPVNQAYKPGNVLRYGADNNAGVTGGDSTAAVRQALLANSRIYFPPGTYIISEQIDVTGAKVIIGDLGGTYANQVSVIAFTGSGRLFSVADGGFSPIYIGHLQISGGSGDDEPCIYSNRPQSIFEYITMESSVGYNNPGIVVEDTGITTSSFGTIVRSCKWVGPFTTPGGVVTPTQCDYTGFSFEVNGGPVSLEEVVAILGNIGILIKQGQVINLFRCSVSRQNALSSTETDTAGQRGISFTGALTTNPTPTPHPVNYKSAASIRSCYDEACANGLVVESCESLSVEDSLFQDVSFGTQPGITLLNGDAQNVTLRNIQVSQANSGAVAIFNGSGNNVLILNSYADAYGGGGAAWLSVNARTDIGWNTVVNGVLTDPAHYVHDLKTLESSFTGTLTGCTTSPTTSISYVKQDRQVTLLLPTLTATSNTTACTITGLPTEIMPVTLKRVVCRVVDNGVPAYGMATFDPAVANTITLGVGAGLAAFTNVGTKGSGLTDLAYSLD